METVVLRAEHMVVGGDAIGRDDGGRVVFVAGALPGELVRVAMRVSKRDFAKGFVVEVLEPSAHRIAPVCDAYERGCGGCDWMHIAPAAQLEFKVDVVAEALRRTGRLANPRVIAGGQVHPWAYRTTVRMARTESGRLGFRSRRSHDVVEVTACPVAVSGVNALIAQLADSPSGSEVVLRVSVTTDEHSVAPGTGAGPIHEVIAGRSLRVSPDSFFQSSPGAAELLVGAVSRLTAVVEMRGATVVDAYAGVGLFAATVARDARHVILVESSLSACADARHNLAGRRVSIVPARVEDWQPEPADSVIADPARSGIDRVGAERVAATGATTIILVSCDAGSLGRDARLLTELGYRHEVTEVIDVFPNTSHVEAVTRFGRGVP